MYSANYFSICSLILYVCVGLYCSYWLHLTYDTGLFIDNRRVKKSSMLFILWLFTALFASLRLVGPYGIGGVDAFGYEMFFIDSSTIERLKETDILFYFFTVGIREVTASPIIYRFVCYSLICFGYIIVIKRFYKKNVSSIPFVMIIYPLLRSFNTMRNSVAIVFFLIGIIYLADKKNLYAVIFIIIACFFHRMTLLYVALLPFYYLFKNVDFNKKSNKIFWFLLFYTVTGYLLSKAVQTYVLAAQLMTSNEGGDLYYLSQSLEQNIFQRIPIMFQHVVLLVMLIFYNNKLPDTPDVKFLRLIILFDIIIQPVSVVFGMWRALEYLYIPRLVFWGYLISGAASCYKFDSRRIFKIGCMCIFISWLVFRIYKEWEPAGFMPYKLIFLS